MKNICKIFVIILLFIFIACEKSITQPEAEAVIIEQLFQGKREIRDKLFSMQFYDHTIYKDVYLDSYNKLESEGVITIEYVEGFWGYLKVAFTEKGLQYKASEPMQDEFDLGGSNTRVKVVASMKQFGGIIDMKKMKKNTYQVNYRTNIIATPFGKYLRTAPIFTEKPITDKLFTTSCTLYFDKESNRWRVM